MSEEKMHSSQVYVMPASPAQTGLWLLVEQDPASTAYHVPAAMRLRGPLDPGALDRALDRLCARHEILRTTLTMADGQVSQVIRPESGHRPEHLDLSRLGDGSEAACRRECARRAAEPFDLERGPLLRITTCRLGPEDHVVSLLMHHIITDGWSTGVLLRELAVLYSAALAGAADPLPPPALQYADFAVWHHDRLASGVQDRQLDHWRAALGDRDLVLELPTDRPRPRVPSYAGETVTLTAAPELAARVRAAAARHGASPFMAAHAALAAVMSRNAAQRHVRIGVPSANRDHADTAEVLGFFVNTLAVTADCDPELTFAALLAQVRESTAQALENGDVPFGEVVRAAGGRRDPSRSPLFQAMIAMDNAPDGHDFAPGLTAHRFDVPRGDAKFDLTLFVREGPDGTSLALEYATDLFDPGTAKSLLHQVREVLDAGSAHPELPLRRLLTVSEEQRRTLAEWAAGPAAPPAPDGASSPLGLFERQAALTPDAVALVAGDRRVNYAELDAMAGRIAGALAGAGVGRADLVGVALSRSVELVASLLAVWKRGAVYVPLDPEQPAARLASIVADARPRVVLEAGGHGSGIAGDVPVLDVTAPPAPSASPAADPAGDPEGGGGDLAYVLYTSGSTGRPKGVQITRSGLFGYLRWAAEYYCPQKPPVAPLHTAAGFDLTVTSLWVPLTRGGSVHLIDEDSPVEGLVAMLSGPARPDLVKLTPAHLEAVCRLLPADALAGLPACFVVGGEALTPDLVRRLFTVAPDARVVNEYGPTETVVGCCAADFTADSPLGERPGVAIGRPVAGTRLYVVDERLEQVPAGTPGELAVGGAGVARGYLGDSARTASAFAPDPFSPVPGARLYRTGDVVRHLPDGRLEYLGRRDDQVKIRGRRIEPAEVAAALREVDGVTDAVVVAVPDHLGRARLAGYVTGAVDADAVRAAAAGVLPDAMVPSAVTVLDTMPLTPHAKIDRAALPAPRFADHSAYVPPATVHQHRLARLYAEVLGVEQVGLEDDFFALGGHSLLATQLIARVREQFGVALPLRALFARPGLREFAEAVAGAPAVDTVPLVRADRAGPVEVSYAQQRMWFLHRLEPDSAFYNVSAAVRLTGPLDEERLRAAVHTAARRHEVLRTVFTEVDGRPAALIGEDPLVDFDRTDLRHADDPGAAARQLAAGLAARPFDLGKGPLTRWTLARVAEQEYVLALSQHHIVSDGWSTGVLLREVRAAYAGIELPVPALQYADFAAWQRTWLASGVLEEQLAHWRTALAGAPPALELPADFPRPAVPGHRGAHLHARLGTATASALTDLAERHGATPFMVLQAVYAALLARRAGQGEVVVGTPVANRSRTDTEDLIGFFVNTLPIRTRVDAREPFGRLLDRVRETCLDAFANQDVPFERLVEDLAPDRDPGRNPVFQAMFILQNAPQGADTGLGDVAMDRLPLEEDMAKFDLTLMAEETQAGPGATETDGSLQLVLEYATDLFTETTARAVLDDFVRACGVLARRDTAEVGELTAVSARERTRLLQEWNATEAPGELGGIVQRVRAHARATPHATAVQDARTALTYRELVARADRLALRLGEAGAGAGDRVALLLDRGVDTATAVLGVLGAGAAYVPLDVRAPRERTARILEDGGARVLLTSPALSAAAHEQAGRTTVLELDGAASPANALREPLGEGDDLGYVLYTSGSTGRPKGAMADRRGIDNHLLAKTRDLRLTATDTVVQNAAQTFVVSVWQLLAALTVGGRTLVLDDETAQDATGLFDRAAAAGATVLQVVPSLLRAALDAWDTLGAAPGLPTLRRLVVTGEALPADLCRRWLARHPHTPLMNAYGATESSDDVAHAHITDPDEAGAVRAPIGRPVRNTRLYVVDEWLEPVPVGVAGELLVGGAGVGRGYLGDPARTAAAFVPDPFSAVPGARAYRTGDVVRYRPDGRLEVLGRRDHQVKVRGQRIEPGEVEVALRAVDGVLDAVVVAVPDHLEQTRLAAYVTGEAEADAVRAAVGGALPEVMVPSAVRVLAALPLTRNGKVDRAALPEPRFADRTAYVPPSTVHEHRLALLYAQVLGVDRVGLDDDFFALGGHSLLATRLTARVREEFGVDLPLRSVFGQPTLRRFAAEVAQAEASAPGSDGEADMEALLSRIEDLSDDEVAELLARGDGTSA